MHQEIQETLTALGPGIVCSRLLRLRSGPEEELPQPKLLVECELCEGWEVVDRFTYRFKIREGVRWQNLAPVNWRELTADDIVYSYERQRTPGWANAPLLQNIEAIEAEGPYTLKITLSPTFPNADFLVSLADGHTKVVAREAVEVEGDLKTGPVVGSGPWIWRSSDENVGSVVSKNPDYFEEGLPFLDEFSTVVIKAGEDVQLAAFVTGEVDVYRVSPSKWDQLNQSGKEFDSFISRQAGSGLILAMNVARPPFDNLDVGKAVLRALDPFNYVDSIWNAQGFASLGIPVVQNEWLLPRDVLRSQYFADPGDARDILENTGLQLPIRFDLTVSDFGNIYIDQARRIEEDLRSVGFDPLLRVLNPSQYTDTVWRDKAYQLSVGVLPPTSTTNSFLFAILHATFGRWNVINHSDLLLDSFIQAQAVEDNPEFRAEVMRELQEYILDQAYMFSPVTSGSRWVFRPEVRGFHPNTAASEYFYWAKTWLED